MPAPLKLFAACFGLAWLASGAVQAAPPASTPSPAAPDYGGRDSALPTVGEAAPDPAASAGRAFEALVVVLAGVGGVVYVLKRFNLVKLGADGKTARITGPAFGRTAVSSAETEVKVVSSQTLPGGALLHVVRIGDRTLLLGATAQSVTNITEWDTPATADGVSLADEFEGYLSRADPNRPDPASGIAAANARLRSLLSPKPPEDFS